MSSEVDTSIEESIIIEIRNASELQLQWEHM